MTEIDPLNLKLYPLDDALLVYHPASHALHVVDGVAAWLLLGIQQKMSREQLLAEYQAAFPDDPPEQPLEATLEQILSLLGAEGLFKPYQQEYQSILSRPAPAVPPGAPGIGLAIADFRVHIQSDCNTVLQTLSHLCPHQQLTPPFTPHVQFELRQTQAHYAIHANGECLSDQLPGDQLLPCLMDYLQILFYQRQPYLMAVHSAVVVSNDVALILPGLSGSGKSTLCSYLVKHGFTGYSDEIAVLREPDGRVIPLPLPMGVKTGSWPVLAKDYPELADAPVWQRPDGRRLKYLALPAHDSTVAATRTPAALDVSRQVVVFPRYDSACDTPVLQPLTALELLTGLTGAGYQLPCAPDENRVEQLLAFARSTPAYRLHYADLATAQRLLMTVLGAAD